MPRKHKSNQKKRIDPRQRLKEMYGASSVKMRIRGKWHDLLYGAKQIKKQSERKDLPFTINQRSKNRSRDSHRAPLPEGNYIRVRNNTNLFIGNKERHGWRMDIHYSHFPNSRQDQHTHTIFFDDLTSDVPRTLMAYDRGLERNRFVISPGRKCKRLEPGEYAHTECIELPDPEEPFERIRRLDTESCNQTREDYLFDCDEEWRLWRGREEDYSEYHEESWHAYNTSCLESLEQRYSEYKEGFLQPNPEIHEP